MKFLEKLHYFLTLFFNTFFRLSAVNKVTFYFMLIFYAFLLLFTLFFTLFYFISILTPKFSYLRFIFKIIFKFIFSEKSYQEFFKIF